MSSEDKKKEEARRAALSPMLTFDDFHPLSSLVQVEIGVLSRRGKLRQRNDDHYLVVRLGREQETLATSLSASDLPPQFKENGYVMLVADGLGEGGAGAVASRVALSTLAHVLMHYGRWNLRVDAKVAESMTERAEWYYLRADAAVFAQSRTNPLMSGMSTTLTAAYSAGEDLFVAHVGHSRAYLFRGGVLTPLTRDHTLKQQMADTRRPASVEKHAQDLRHILTDALGSRGGPPAVDVERFKLQNGDCVLVCTNGLTDVVTDTQIAEVLALRRRSEEQCQLLMDLAEQAGGEDNTTVVLAQYQIPAL
jgi:PPM family protein phosphatase